MDTPFVVQKCTCYFCVLGPENTPHPGTFVLAPPPPPDTVGGDEKIYLGVQKAPGALKTI